MRQEKDIELVDPQTLEIALIDKFKSALNNAQTLTDFQVKQGDLDGAHINELQYANTSCPTHGSSEVFAVTKHEAGETVSVKATNFDRFPDDTIDITAMADGEMKIENGVLVKSSNPGLIGGSVHRLHAIKDSLKGDCEAKLILDEAHSLMDDLTAKHQGDKSFPIPIVISGKRYKGWAFIGVNTIIVGVTGAKVQQELVHERGDRNSFKATRYSYASEQPKIINHGVAKRQELEFVASNPVYLKNCLYLLRTLQLTMSQGVSRETKPVQKPLQNQPDQGEAIEILIPQTRPF